MDRRKDAAEIMVVGRVVVKTARPRTRTHEHANETVYLTCGGSQASALPTRDPYDQAHGVRDGFGMLLPAAVRLEGGRIVRNRLVRAKPRRYHPSQMTTGGVAVDSMFDAWHEAVVRLATAGVVVTAAAEHARAIEAADSAARGEGIRLRDILHPRTRQRTTWREAEMEREASRILREAGHTDDET